MKKISLLFLIVLGLWSNANAQNPNQSRSGRNLIPNEQTMQTINAAEYIFEGEILEDKSYYNKDSSKMYTSNKVKVNAVYKGNLTEGQIVEQIEEGGTIGLDERVNRHGISVGYREPYILFCKKLTKLPVPNQAYNLPVKMSYVNNRSCLEYADESDITMFGLNHIGFKTKEDVESLLLKVPGVSIPQKKQAEVLIESKPPAEPIFWDFTPNVQTIKTINAADYIFEGEKIESRSYYNKDSSKIYTSTKVKVHTIYKGNLNEGQIIELIGEGGRIGIDVRVSMHRPATGLRNPYILFCKKINTLPVPNEGYRLSVKVSYVNNLSYLVYGGGKGTAMHGFNDIGFRTRASLDSLLLKIPGVTFLKKKVQTTPSLNLQQSKAPSFEDFMAMQNKRATIAKANLNALRTQPKVKLKAATATSSTVTPTQLILTLTNDSIKTENGYQYYQFDVTASANNSTTYYQNSIIRLNYDTIAFGSNIATTSGALTLSRGTGFAATEYAVHQYNVNRSRINISLNDTAVNATSGNRTPLTTSPIQLFRVKIKISNCAVKPNFIIAEQSFTSGLSWYNLSATANPHDGSNTIFYDSTTYINNLTNSLCPTISDFSPKKIHSGNNELLTITGTGFGTTQGNVLFKNADVRGDTLLKGLDNVYVKPGGWTDTKIEVYVPSIVTENSDINEPDPGAGSGTFKVVKANGAEAVTSTPLDIEYAFLNVGDGTTDNPFDILHLAKINCINGLVFTLDTSFQAYPDAVATVQKAANDWANVLGITVAIEKNATNQIVYANGASTPNKKVIYFDRNYSGTAETSTIGNKVGSGSSSKYYRTDSDIRIAHPDIKNWHFTTNDDLPAFKRDFYECITHEMGHAIGLNHDVDIATGNGTKEVMYYAVVYYGTVITANQRINLNNYGARTVAGGKAKIAKDKAKTWATTIVATLGTPNPTPPTITTSGSATICQGGSVTLTSSSVSGNVWSNGATTQYYGYGIG